jgi:hypothetical protein
MVGARQSAVSFSPDGRYLAFNQMSTGMDGMGMMGSEGGTMSGGTGIWMLPMQGDRTPQRFVTSTFVQGSGRFSPDGKWVAYCSNESGRNEIYVQPWPGPGPKVQFSSDGGTDPIWSRGSQELFYRNGERIMVVAVVTTPTFRASRPRVLWEGTYSHGMSSSCGPAGTTEGNYDVTGDGGRFLMIKDLDEHTLAPGFVRSDQIGNRAVGVNRLRCPREAKLGSGGVHERRHEGREGRPNLSPFDAAGSEGEHHGSR